MRGAPTSTILIGFHIKHILPVRNHIFKSLCQFPFVVSGFSVLKPLRALSFIDASGQNRICITNASRFLNFRVMTQAFTMPPPSPEKGRTVCTSTELSITSD